MDRPTCATCKWWQLESEDAVRPSVHRCDHPKLNGDMGIDADDCAFPDSSVGVWTGPDFGCIHHEPVEVKS